MTADEKIAEFHNNLKLKKSVMGYDTFEVLESYKNLDKLYREAFDEENGKLLEQIKTLTDKVKNQEMQLSAMSSQNQKLYKENETLLNDMSRFKQSDNERQIYLEKAELLSTAMLQIKQEDTEKSRQLEIQRQVIMEQAKQEAKAYLEQQQSENAWRVSAAEAKVEALEKKRSAIAEQLRQVGFLISDQINILAPDEAEKS